MRTYVHSISFFTFIAIIKNAGLAERGELAGRERRTRNVGGRGGGGGAREEIRRKWTRFRYFGVRIAHRRSRASDLPHDSFFSLWRVLSFSRQDGCSHASEKSLILPRRERTYSVAWLQSEPATRSRRLSFPGNRTETESAPGLYFPYFSYRKIETASPRVPLRFRTIEHSQLTYANITFCDRST